MKKRIANLLRALAQRISPQVVYTVYQDDAWALDNNVQTISVHYSEAGAQAFMTEREEVHELGGGSSDDRFWVEPLVLTS